MNLLMIRKTNVDFGGKGTTIDLNQCLLIMIYGEQIVNSAPIHRYFMPFPFIFTPLTRCRRWANSMSGILKKTHARIWQVAQMRACA